MAKGKVETMSIRGIFSKSLFCILYNVLKELKKDGVLGQEGIHEFGPNLEFESPK